MYPTETTVGLVPATLPKETRTVAVNPNGATKVRLLHEALSRARMRRPQADYTARTEALRPARQVAMQARNRSARELGL